MWQCEEGQALEERGPQSESCETAGAFTAGPGCCFFRAVWRVACWLLGWNFLRVPIFQFFLVVPRSFKTLFATSMSQGPNIFLSSMDNRVFVQFCLGCVEQIPCYGQPCVRPDFSRGPRGTRQSVFQGGVRSPTEAGDSRKAETHRQVA